MFVLDDGGEVDLDLGNYERYLNITLTRENNITTGKIYQHVIEKERRGDYLGRTVQVVPHLTDAVQDWIERVARIPVDDTNEEPDVCIIELGGTVGYVMEIPWRILYVYRSVSKLMCRKRHRVRSFYREYETVEKKSWQRQFPTDTCVIRKCVLSKRLLSVTNQESGASDCRRTKNQTDTAGYTGR